MYESQFSLKRRPFAATPDPKCFLSSGLIQAALDELVVCVEQGQGVAIVSAPAGTGKTLLCERLRLELETRFRVVFLRHASFMTRRALLQSILADLDHAYRRQDEQELRLELVPAIRALNPAREALVLICDESHMLSEDLLEELRILSDLAENGCPLVRLVLVGQPALEETLASPGLEALNQRIRAHVCLDSFDRAGAQDYIDYRITWAGGRTAEIFTPEALDLICHVSEGVPRCINQLCDHSLLLAYVAEQSPVSVDIIREALQDLRQLPLHWNESILSDRTSLADNSDVAESAIDRIPAAPKVSADEIQSYEFGADVAETEFPGSYSDDIQEIISDDDPDCESFEVGEQDDVSSLSAVDELDATQDIAKWTMMTREPAVIEKQPGLSVPTVRSGEVVEEIVWDRYAAIDGGFPIPQVAQCDTQEANQVHCKCSASSHATKLRSSVMAPSLESAPSKSTGNDDFEQVCERLNELLPEITEVAAWDWGGPEFRHPDSEGKDPGSDDWDSLEAELGMAVRELSSEVRAELNESRRGQSAVEELEQVFDDESIGGASIEIGADTVTQPMTAKPSEGTRRADTSNETVSRPYRNLFSQLRRKQQGLL